MIQSGVQVEFHMEWDYRQLYILLKTDNVRFYTYQLKSQKIAKVVFRRD